MKFFLQLTTAIAVLSSDLLLSVSANNNNCNRDVYFSIDNDASVYGTVWSLKDKRTGDIELVGDNTKPKDPIREPAGIVGAGITPGIGKFLCPNRTYLLKIRNTQENKCPFKVYVGGVLREKGGKDSCDINIPIPVDDSDTPAPTPWDTDDEWELDIPMWPNGRLDECQGDCVGKDNKCKEDLVCYERGNNSDKSVPGCRGFAKGTTDYCIDARKDSNELEFIGGAYGKPDYGPYGRCRGDCDDDDDCDGYLKCYQRSSSNKKRVPGCDGQPEGSIDYCVDPGDIYTRRPTKRPTRRPPTPRPTKRPTRRPPTPRPTRRPRPTPRPTRRPTRGPDKEDCFVEVQLLTDKYPSENSWVVKEIQSNGNKKLVFAGNGFNEQYRNYNSGQRLPVGKYKFILSDKYQDGMIGGEYKVLVDGKSVGSGGGDFGKEAIIEFRCRGNSSTNRDGDFGDDDDDDFPVGGCKYREQVARSGEWMQGPTHKCKCHSGKWKQCVRTNQ